MRGRKKGTQKTGGRKRNTPNKTTKECHELFVSIMNGQMESIKVALKKVEKEDSEKYLNTISKLFQYYMPRKTDVTSDNEKIVPIIPTLIIT